MKGIFSQMNNWALKTCLKLVKILVTSHWVRGVFFCLATGVIMMFVKLLCRFLDLSHLPPVSQCSVNGMCQNPAGQWPPLREGGPCVDETTCFPPSFPQLLWKAALFIYNFDGFPVSPHLQNNLEEPPFHNMLRCSSVKPKSFWVLSFLFYELLRWIWLNSCKVTASVSSKMLGVFIPHRGIAKINELMSVLYFEDEMLSVWVLLLLERC